VAGVSERRARHYCECHRPHGASRPGVERPGTGPAPVAQVASFLNEALAPLQKLRQLGDRDIVLGLIAFMAVTTALSTIIGLSIFVFYGLISAQPKHQYPKQHHSPVKKDRQLGDVSLFLMRSTSP
jgi:hypothetical protein